MHKWSTSINDIRNQKDLTLAVIGNPNTGKSTLINAFSGARLRVGNWPGVTVEKKSTSFSFRGRHINLVDLPGIYSLSPYNEEEIIARNFLLFEHFDAIINVVDACNLERNLYLTIQLLELQRPIVVAINMVDEAQNAGLDININDLSIFLGCPVCPIVATKGEGLNYLLENVLEITSSSHFLTPNFFYGTEIEHSARKIMESFSFMRINEISKYPKMWLALKIIEGDALVLQELGLPLNSPLRVSNIENISKFYGEELDIFLISRRYDIAHSLAKEVIRKSSPPRREITEKIDAIILNRFFGIPIFLLIMWLLFKLTFDLSAPFTDWIDSLFSGFLQRQVLFLSNLIGAPDWSVSLFTEGVIGGVGLVLSFTPSIMILIFLINFIEASGYIARAAFLMDRVMHALGLPGKSFIPLILGFGCNVPALYATRTLESQKERILTALLIPFMSCSARLPVYVLFAGTFFPDSAPTILWALYLIGISLAVITGLILKKKFFSQEDPPFIMELPPYRLPNFRALYRQTWEKGKLFLIRAGTYILCISIIVWLLLNFPWGIKNKNESYLGQLGSSIAPIFAPLGFGYWEASVSLIGGIMAKEMIITTMAQIYSSDKERSRDEENRPFFTNEIKKIIIDLISAVQKAIINVTAIYNVKSLNQDIPEKDQSLKKAISNSFSPLSAFSFSVFVLIYMPCVVFLTAFRQEFLSWKWPLLSLFLHCTVAWIVAFAIYQGGLIIGLS
ncbi:MAG: ferrous iron transport protein B [Syntrophales bacterium]|nr:ferrous iron transport protein B [Syntrophales bacterium]